MSYVAQIGEFMSGDFMSGDFLTWIRLRPVTFYRRLSATGIARACIKFTSQIFLLISNKISLCFY